MVDNKSGRPENVGGGSGNEAAPFPVFARTHIAFLREHAASEIRRLQVEEELPRNRRSVAGVADEALLKGWDSRGRKPDSISWEEWLLAVLARVLDDAVRHAAETTPRDPEPDPTDDQVDVDANSTQWRQCQMLESHDPDIWEDHYPDRAPYKSLREATPQEEREALLSYLTPLPPSDREAFCLFIFEGHDWSEIAEAQSRDVSTVRDAVRGAVRTLIQRERDAGGSDVAIDSRVGD